MKNRVLIILFTMSLLFASTYLANAQPWSLSDPTTLNVDGKKAILGPAIPPSPNSNLYDVLQLIATAAQTNANQAYAVQRFGNTPFGQIGLIPSVDINYLTVSPSRSSGDLVLSIPPNIPGENEQQDIILSSRNLGHRDPITGNYDGGGKIVLSTSHMPGYDIERMVVTPQGLIGLNVPATSAYVGGLPSHGLQLGDRGAIDYFIPNMGGNSATSFLHNTKWVNGTGTVRMISNIGGGNISLTDAGYIYFRGFDAAETNLGWKPEEMMTLDPNGRLCIGGGNMPSSIGPNDPPTDDVWGEHKLWVEGDAGVRNRLTVGMVGIPLGTAYDRYKLWVDGDGAVLGTFRATEVIVENLPWPDYVFKKDYKLASLAEVEQHIAEKGHLPGIPSEAEVAEKGVNLGEMQAKLLEKIEEMTLRMIEQEKTIQAMQSKINSLESNK